MIHIVLRQPEIAPNTGNIARLCYGNRFRLHLIEPLGFHLDSARLRRAGLDFWDRLDLQVHPDWAGFIEKNPSAESGDGFYFTTRGGKTFWTVDFPATVYLVFGSETSGFPQDFRDAHESYLTTIPMLEKTGRSLNLSNAVAVAAYEALRQSHSRAGISSSG